MDKSFYQADTPEEALEIYRRINNNLYTEVKNTVIKNILSSLRLLMPWSSLDLLEIGAGGGYWTEYFLGLGAQVTCVDTCESILKGNEKLHPQAKFVLADATGVEIENKFDLVFAKDVLEHIPEDETFLANMYKHLNQDGLILINTQNSLSLNWLLQGGYHFLRGNKEWKGWDPTHVRFYHWHSLSRKLKKAGFIPIKWFGSYYLPYRILSDHFGPGWESKLFCPVEYSGLFSFFPFNISAWNIGVIARKSGMD